MEQSLSNAFLILFVGMITVFVVLLLVVLTGKMLIKLVDNISYDKLEASPTIKFVPKLSEYEDREGIDRKKIAAIVASIDVITQGKGYITKVEKLS